MASSRRYLLSAPKWGQGSEVSRESNDNARQPFCKPLYQLALMLALTFAPYILTFGPCACGVSLLSTGANISLAQGVVVTSCNLRSCCFFIQPLAQIVHLRTWWHHPLQLALVVLFHPATGANTALAPRQLALCGGINSIHTLLIGMCKFV